MAGTLIEIDRTPVEREESPGSPEELAQVLRAASARSFSVIPMGGRTKMHLGNPPRSATLAVHTRGLRGIVEYEPDNMTVSVLAGTPLQELQHALRKSNQFLPLDPPRPAQATVGGLAACNTSGPIRFRYGTIRDLLIGIRIVHADGTQTKAGGKLVKNVTGYDMCKLYIGSLGTLGILSELTFKVQPRPDTTATALLSYPSACAALEAAQAFLQADLLPDALEAWNGPAFETLAGEQSPSAWTLMVRFSEVAPAVRWQMTRLEEVLPGTKGSILRILDAAASESWWNRAASARGLRDAGSETNGEGASVKCSFLYGSAPAVIAHLEEIGKRLEAQTSLFCHAGNLVIYARYRWSSEEPPAEELRREFTLLRRHCAEGGGHTVVEEVRPEVKSGFDIWGYDAPALEIMRRIKHEFDPKGILNPGRYVGGI